GGAGGDDGFGVWVDAQPPIIELMGGNGVPQVGDAPARSVLVVAVAHCRDRRINDVVGSIGIGEPLSEIDGTGLGGHSRHFGENGGAEPIEPATGRLHSTRIRAASRRSRTAPTLR